MREAGSEDAGRSIETNPPVDESAAGAAGLGVDCDGVGLKVVVGVGAEFCGASGGCGGDGCCCCGGVHTAGIWSRVAGCVGNILAKLLETCAMALPPLPPPPAPDMSPSGPHCDRAPMLEVVSEGLAASFGEASRPELAVENELVEALPRGESWVVCICCS